MRSSDAGSPEPSSTDDEYAVLVERVDTAIVLAVAGELDMITAPTLRERIADVCTEAPALVVIDLTEVRFLGSMGIAALVFAHMQASAGTTVRVVANGPATAGVLTMMGVDRTLAMFSTRADALANG